MNTLGDWVGIRTADHLVALIAVLGFILGVVNLIISQWARLPWSLAWRRRRALRRMDAMCELQWSIYEIKRAIDTGEQIVATASVDEMVEHALRQQSEQEQWCTLQTVPCRIRPDGHARVDKRQETPLAMAFTQPWYTRLNWTIELPTGTKVNQTFRIVSRGRSYNITAVFDDYSDAEVVQVAAWSQQQ